jgi:cellulose synthase/poly-beta-1,6-N-acetylglucosamine synthase-like glycosyltransferase
MWVMSSLIFLTLAMTSLLLCVQAAYTLYMMVYTWDQPAADEHARAPSRFRAAERSFTVLLPARHEEEVIETTIERVVRSNYPSALLQVLVICSIDDPGTIARAREKVRQLGTQGMHNVDVLVFDDGPINKPHGLNFALPLAHNDVVCIFDAEDDIHPEILNVVNTLMLDEQVDVVQAGVQLMDYKSSWYSSLNVLEYFFWFRSRLHYQARYGSIPLGGTTVFFSRELLLRIGGWDESNLTEDADIGIRLCVEGEKVRVVYDDRYVTKEETPPTLRQFIRQRTRWSQGFMQTLSKGTWKQLPTRSQRLLALYTLAFPNLQAALGVYAIFSLATAVAAKAPVLIALLSYLPVLMLLAHFVTAIVGLYEFADAHGLRPSRSTVVKMALAWFPYQLVLSYAALRALRRQALGVNNWEKTAHVGAHRNEQLTESASNVA